ncbi:MAG: hypothetical protein HQL76_12045 [Magnetococcales bacterium]|nr:hypothetical protein [Magnetococcales bacterium]
MEENGARKTLLPAGTAAAMLESITLRGIGYWLKKRFKVTWIPATGPDFK